MKCFLTFVLLSASVCAGLCAEKPVHKFGYVPDARGTPKRNVIHSTAFAAARIAPSSDLRPDMPPIWDQGSIGSCTGHGAAAVQDYIHHKLTGAFYAPSRLAPYYWARVAEGTVNQDAGAQIHDVVASLLKQGCPPEKVWPYVPSDFAKRPSATAIAQGLTHQALHAYSVDLDSNLIQIRQALSAGLPVVFGAYVYSQIKDLDIFNQTLKMPKKGQRSIGGHCMVICGHDDAKRVLIIRNSWSTLWGKNGYAYFPYDYFVPRIVSDLWVVDRAE